MISIRTEKECCGCGACSAVCPKNCVSMTERTLGHLFPSVEQNKCVGCGLCESVCPILNETSLPTGNKQSAFAAYAKNDAIRFSGSSGGMFGVFAERLLRGGYLVYGAAFDENLKLNCTSASNLDELKPLFKSKYLQSNATSKYEEVKKNLTEGKKVLFVSTPCQVYALKRYLRCDYENLITVDFFCHGVPSQRFFDECIAVEEKMKKSNIVGYSFRTKIRSGSTPHYYSETIIDDNGRKREITGFYFKSPFYAFFQKYINLRESCYNCRFAGRNRASDITIGDFHDIDNYVSGINRFNGVSTVIINTPKGEKLWNICSEAIEKYPVDIDVLINDGICFSGGTERPKKREEFLNDYQNMSMDELIHKWVDKKNYRKQELYYRLPSCVRRILKHVLGAN